MKVSTGKLMWIVGSAMIAASVLHGYFWVAFLGNAMAVIGGYMEGKAAQPAGEKP